MKTEYTDIKEVKHTVEHISPENADESRKEQVAEALCNVFCKREKVPA